MSSDTARCTSAAARSCPGTSASSADSAERGHSFELGHERSLQHLALCRQAQLVERGVISCQRGPELGQGATTFLSEEETTGPVGELVPGGAVYLPSFVEHFVAAEDLFHQEDWTTSIVPCLDRLVEAIEVARGVRQAVDVIDAEAGDPRVGAEHGHEVVGPGEDLGVFDAYADETVDVEEPPVVPGGVSQTPEGRPEMLRRQDVEERFAAVTVRREGKMLPVHVEDHAVRLPADGRLTTGIGERLAQDRRQYSPAVLAPIDVEGVCDVRTLSPAQGVPPPGVGGVRGHVVRHDVEKRPHAANTELIEERREFVRASRGRGRAGPDRSRRSRACSPGLRPTRVRGRGSRSRARGDRARAHGPPKTRVR